VAGRASAQDESSTCSSRAATRVGRVSRRLFCTAVNSLIRATSRAIFFAVGGIGWLLAVCKKLPAGLRSLWLVVTMVLGVIFVWMMVRLLRLADTTN
ncbi:hypothetical protein FK513_28155, partial [Klebsiella pneumoniae]|nr:hypothetical protein [Klebsiella pneumoniae]